MEEGGAELCEGTIERVGSDGRTAVGGGGGAAILSPCSGGGAGRCWSVLTVYYLYKILKSDIQMILLLGTYITT